MDFERLSREELVDLLHELSARREERAPESSEAARALHELQVHQLELDMQNRELREAHEALEESRDRYADLYDFAPMAYCSIDGQGIVQELNLTAASLFRRERHAAVGRPLTMLVRFENPQSFWHHLGACVTSAEPVISEFRLLIEGRILHVQATSVPVLKLGGPARMFRTAFTDITERKRAEWEREAALNSERRLRSLLEALDRAHIEAAEALARPGRDGLQQMMDVIVRHARHVTSAHAAQLELRRVSDQFGPLEASDRDPDAVAALDAGAHVLDVQLGYGGRVLADLSVRRGHASGPFTSDAPHALQMLAERFGSSLEIARLRMLEARETVRLSLLERVDRKLRRAQEIEASRAAVGDVADVVTPDFADLCIVHLMRDGALQLHKIAHASSNRLQLLAVCLRDEQLSTWVARSLSELARSREPHLLRLVAPQPDQGYSPYADLTGTLQTSSLIVAPLWARDRLLGTICFGRQRTGDEYDLGLLGWAQEIAGRCAAALDAGGLVHELREAVQWRENLMAMISHDLKNPLSAISLSALSMAPEAPQTERRSSHKQVDLIRRSAQHMHHMINDLLSASLLEAGSFRVELHRESAHELVEEACQLVEPLLTARGLRLQKDVGRALPFVFADREQILRVFSNLLGNAAKFTPPKGEIRVAATYTDDTVRFSVSDTGPGIPEEQQSRLFERYCKGRRGSVGLGLGLYISRAIVEAHEGRIWLDNSSEGGTRFCFELRRSDPSH